MLSFLMQHEVTSRFVSARYQVMRIIRQVVSWLPAEGVHLIGKYLHGAGMAQRLMLVIMMALSREAERTVECTLQVCYQLLLKARSEYLPLMQRNGIVQMIESTYYVMAATTPPTPVCQLGEERGEEEEEQAETTTEMGTEAEEEEENDGEEEEGPMYSQEREEHVQERRGGILPRRLIRYDGHEGNLPSFFHEPLDASLLCISIYCPSVLFSYWRCNAF